MTATGIALQPLVGRRRSSAGSHDGARELTVGAVPRAVGWARHWVVRQVAGAGAPQGVVQVAELLSSELVTNALRHGEASDLITVRVSVDETAVLVTVDDDGDRLPRLGRPQPDALCGRGLPLVEELSAEWGTRRRPTGGKSVWFRLDL